MGRKLPGQKCPGQFFLHIQTYRFLGFSISFLLALPYKMWYHIFKNKQFKNKLFKVWGHKEEGLNKQVELMLRGARYKQLLENQISHVRKKYNLRKVDVEILHYLSAGVGGDTSKEIQKATKLTKGHISQSIFRMQEMGFLEFAPDERDRRCVHLVLTPKAEALIEDIQHIWDEVSCIIFQGITPEEKQVLESVAQKMDRNIDTALQYK